MVPFTPSTATPSAGRVTSAGHMDALRPESHALSLSEDLRDSARRLRELERVRVQLVGTLLDVQQACSVSRDQEHAQRLLSAAVRDLEEHDALLYDARTFHSTMETCGPRLLG